MKRYGKAGSRPCGLGRAAAGFTLIELVAVIAIVAILAGLAFPSYQSVLRKGRRADATTSLLRIQLQQERYRSDHGRYAARLEELGWDTDPVESPAGYYTLSLEHGADPRGGFRARAVAKAGSDQARDRCTVLVIGQDGPDRESSSAPDCWPG